VRAVFRKNGRSRSGELELAGKGKEKGVSLPMGPKTGRVLSLGKKGGGKGRKRM